jgi:hypothetical protein
MSQSADAKIGWGVSLHDDSEYGEGNHPSLKDDDGDETVDLYDLVAKDEYKDVLEYDWAGSLFNENYGIIFFKRGYYTSYYGSEFISDPQSMFLGPTHAERVLMDVFLTEAGFTGDRAIRLILAASYG